MTILIFGSHCDHGSGHDEGRRRVIEAGFNHHMVKTVDLDVLQPLMTRSDPAGSASSGRAALL